MHLQPVVREIRLMRQNALRLCAVALVLFFGACGESDSTPGPGELGGACGQTQACSPGLICESEICTQPVSDSDSGVVVSEDAGFSFPDAGPTGCTELSLYDQSATAPSNVRVFLSAKDCDGAPEPSLAITDFVLTSDDQILPQGEFVLVPPEKAFRYYHQVLLELSDQSTLASVVSALRAYLEELVEGSTRHFVSIKIMEPQNGVTTYQEFSNDYSVLDRSARDLLEWTTQSGTTAVDQSMLNELQNLDAVVDSSSVAVTQGTLLFFVQNPSSLPSGFSTELVSLVRDSQLKVFGVGLSIEETMFESVTNQNAATADGVSELTGNFRTVASNLKAHSDADYALGFCSQERQGTSQLTIATNNSQNRLELEYSSDGFIDGCMLETVTNPCGNSQCGVVEGLSCGTCPGGQYCDPQRQCITIPLAPTSPMIAIQPLEPKTQDDLVCIISEPSMVEGGSAITYEFTWMKDGSPEIYSTSSIAASFTQRGDLWTCEVVARANNLESSIVSSSVRVLNTRPPEPTITVQPLMPYTTDNLECEVETTGTDPDGDTITYDFEWVNGATTITGAVLDSNLTTKNQNWKCRVTASDGVGQSAPVESQPLRILNSPPTTPGIVIRPNLVTDRDDLTCAIARPSEDADNDNISYRFEWTDGSQTYTGEVLARNNTNYGEDWTCTVTPSDQASNGIPAAKTVRIWDDCQALSFDGMNDYVDLGRPLNLSLTGTVSIEFWVRPNSLSAGSLVRFGGGESSTLEADNLLYNIAMSSSPGHLAFGHEFGSIGQANSYVTGSSLLQAGNWHHVALVRDGVIRTYRLYVDGVALPFILFSNNASGGSNATLTIGGTGQTGSTAWFDGVIDEVRIWNRSLSQQQIMQNMSSSIDPSQAQGLVGYWPLQARTGTTAFDRSGYSNDGQVQGASWTTTSICQVN